LRPGCCLEFYAGVRTGALASWCFPVTRLRQIFFRWRSLIILAIAVAAIVALVFIWSALDWRQVTHVIERLDPLVVFVLMAVLPLAGFSISVVYLVAGAKFGPLGGGAVIAAATAIHLLAANWIGRGFLRAPIERLLEKRKHHLPHMPPGENVAFATLAVLVPGLPYFARNYLLAITEVPLRIYFWVCLPLYVAHSYLTILVGDFGRNLDRTTLLILGTVYGLKLAICAYLIWRIRGRFVRMKLANEETAARPTST